MRLEREERLRILIAGNGKRRREQIVETVSALGHVVVLTETDLSDIGSVTRTERPDVALVILGESSAAALLTIKRIVQEAACPVIALLDVEDRAFVDEAAKVGIFSYISASEDAAAVQSSIDIALRRFAEYHALEGAFGRRAVTERAKGVLMERHAITEEDAFNMLRAEARRSERKVVDVAEAVIVSQPLLPARGRTHETSAPAMAPEKPSSQ